ncbi:MAG: hypothetical protein IJ794_06745 [Lachnospiraceae bacterium]|nr:hypothetical protein [Lachnospiraceae bacterium]
MFGLRLPDIRNAHKKNKELEELLAKVASNVANNYKDAAQKEFAAYRSKLDELKTGGGLNEKQIAYYENCAAEFQEKLKGFTHKDQKPYWH